MQKQAATILSAELMGFQTLAEHLSPKEITPLMSELHALIDNTIRLHQGNINRFTGDTFLAVFYLNKSGSPASINAADAVFEIKDRLDSFTQEKKLPAPFELKVGIASGNIISGNIGSGDKKQETVMGEAINHANRICQFAGEGQILMDENTHEVVRDNCEFQILEPIPIKGSERTLGVFELLGKKRIKLKPEEFSERKITSEMVGRNREMELIEVVVKKLMAGEGSVMNIVGKAGIGKSRLIDEMKIQPLMKKAALLEGRAQSIGKNLSFHPIVHIIKSWAGITEEDPPSVSPGKLQQSIIRVAHEQADEIFPFLATMMGMPIEGKHKERVAGIEGEALEKLILKNLRDLIAAAAAIRPLIILIEDLHWADTSSITFLESLFKLVKKNQILFINVFRPGHKETGDFIQQFLNENLQEDHITIKINPLLETESQELIGNLLHNISMPAEICEMIIHKTEGNPFFIEEVIRSFIDDGIVEIKGNEFFITEKIHEANIPETINEVILSRVDKLDEKTKDLLKTASVIGRNFYFKVLEEAADTIGELDDRIEYLKDVQLIGESKKKEEIEFLFKHALAQQTTYESIIQNTKKELHLKIARSIEKVFTENLHEHYGSLAYHYEKAENVEKTEEYLIKAGDEAIKSGAFSEALDFYKRCLKLYAENAMLNIDKNRVYKLEEKIASAHHGKGEHAAALNYYNKIISFYGLHVPENKIILGLKVIYCLLFLQFILRFPFLLFRKKADEKKEKLVYYLSLNGMALTTVNPKKLFFDVILITPDFFTHHFSDTGKGPGLLAQYGGVFSYTGLSMKTGERVLNLAEKKVIKKNSFSWVKYKFTKYHHYHSLGRWDDWPETEEIVRTGLNNGMFYEITIFYMFMGLTRIEQGSRENIMKCLNGMTEISDNYDNIHARAQYYRLYAHYAGKFRDYETGIRITEDGLKYTIKEGHIMLTYSIYSYRSILHSSKNELSDAEHYLSEAEKILSTRKLVKLHLCTYLLAKCHYLFSLIRNKNNLNENSSAEKGELQKIINKLLKNAKAVASFQTEGNRLQAVLLQHKGKNNKAFQYYIKSIKTGEKYGAHLELSRCYFELGKFLSDPKTKYNELNGNSASHYLEKAKSMFEEMDLQWDLEEYRKFTEKIL